MKGKKKEKEGRVIRVHKNTYAASYWHLLAPKAVPLIYVYTALSL